ncbi:MAG: YkgJ family cysteine cluster protein [Candidatus Micrarchaeota archaeon]
MDRINPCSLCSAPCCKDYTVTVTSFDILTISQRAKLPPSKFAKIAECTLFNKDPETVLRFSDVDFPEGYILIIKSHPCFFLDIKNRCMIHEYAPLTCRRYPFDISGRMNARYCPSHSKLLFLIQGPEVEVKPYMRRIEAYRKLVGEWNDNPGRHQDCLEWLLKRSAEHRF